MRPPAVSRSRSCRISPETIYIGIGSASPAMTQELKADYPTELAGDQYIRQIYLGGLTHHRSDCGHAKDYLRIDDVTRLKYPWPNVGN